MVIIIATGENVCAVLIMIIVFYRVRGLSALLAADAELFVGEFFPPIRFKFISKYVFQFTHPALYCFVSSIAYLNLLQSIGRVQKGYRR